jgi:hypothetical protein
VTGSVSVLNFPATQTVAGTVTVGNTVGFLSASDSDSNLTENIAVAMSYNNILGISNPVTIGSLPAISGTVTANVVGTREFIDLNSTTVSGFLTVGGWDFVNASHAAIPLNDGGTGVNISFDGLNGQPLTVVNHGSAAFFATVTVGNTVTVAGTVTANPTGTQTVAGTVTASLANVVADDEYHGLPHVRVNGGFGRGVELAGIDYSGSQVIIWEGGGIPVFPRDDSSLNAPFPVAGTVTVGNLPSGALTTRFGSVTTAGTAQLTSAVTNANRKYLLLQNISTGAVTVGVGFVPTTTQGIALAAGAGLTFDAFCPTGAVHWLGGTAGAPFTILEG